MMMPFTKFVLTGIPIYKSLLIFRFVFSIVMQEKQVGMLLLDGSTRLEGMLYPKGGHYVQEDTVTQYVSLII
jgi:hypothetical protein